MANTTKTKKLQKALDVTEKLEVTHVYHSQKGVVVGRGKNGSRVEVTARDFEAESLEALMKKIQHAFDTNTLDIDLEMDKIIAAGVEIVDESSVEIEGKVYTNTSIHNEVFGDQDFFNALVDEGIILDTCPTDLDILLGNCKCGCCK